MEQVEVTTLSSRGQVVIPQGLRESLFLKEGAKFVVYGNADTIILKRISAPLPEELKAMLARSRKLAKEKGLKKSEVQAMIDRERKKS